MINICIHECVNEILLALTTELVLLNAFFVVLVDNAKDWEAKSSDFFIGKTTMFFIQACCFLVVVRADLEWITQRRWSSFINAAKIDRLGSAGADRLEVERVETNSGNRRFHPLVRTISNTQFFNSLSRLNMAFIRRINKWERFHHSNPMRHLQNNGG